MVYLSSMLFWENYGSVCNKTFCLFFLNSGAPLCILFEKYLRNKIMLPENWKENRNLVFIFEFLVFFDTLLHFCDRLDIVGGQ